MSQPTVIRSTEELETYISASADRPVFLFKHSLTCPISTAAHHEYLRFVESHPDQAVYTLLEVQNARPLSQEIAQRFGIRHESPQAILLRDGQPSWNASHWSIKEEALGEALS